MMASTTLIIVIAAIIGAGTYISATLYFISAAQREMRAMREEVQAMRMELKEIKSAVEKPQDA